MTHGSWCELAPAAESDSNVALLFTVNNVQSNQSGGSGQGQLEGQDPLVPGTLMKSGIILGRLL
jgi:hypothetical protein